MKTPCVTLGGQAERKLLPIGAASAAHLSGPRATVKSQTPATNPKLPRGLRRGTP